MFPFNLVKGGLNMGLILVLYKPVVTALRKARLVPESTGSEHVSKGRTITISVVALFLTITAVFLGLVLAGVI